MPACGDHRPSPAKRGGSSWRHPAAVSLKSSRPADLDFVASATVLVFYDSVYVPSITATGTINSTEQLSGLPGAGPFNATFVNAGVVGSFDYEPYAGIALGAPFTATREFTSIVNGAAALAYLQLFAPTFTGNAMLTLPTPSGVQIRRIVDVPQGMLTVAYNYTATVTPVPEPETYALLVAGLGAVGLVSRRRSGRR